MVSLLGGMVSLLGGMVSLAGGGEGAVHHPLPKAMNVNFHIRPGSLWWDSGNVIFWWRPGLVVIHNIAKFPPIFRLWIIDNFDDRPNIMQAGLFIFLILRCDFIAFLYLAALSSSSHPAPCPSKYENVMTVVILTLFMKDAVKANGNLPKRG
jgi:hypothetical protein